MSRRHGGGSDVSTGVGIGSGSTNTPGKRAPTDAIARGDAQTIPRAGLLARPLLVDGEPEGDAQDKTVFLEKLYPLVVATANTALVPMTAEGCPFIDEYFAKYRSATAAETLAVILRFAPTTRAARTADALIEPLLARVREGIATWKTTGRLPSQLETAAPGAAAAVGAKKPQSVASIGADLGPGQRVDPSVAARMSDVIGADVSHAQVHTGPAAAKLAADVDASAFAAGEHVVFGSGQYQPGTLAGDALLAHELAHVAQQADAARDPEQRQKPLGAEQASAETNANEVAAHAAGKKPKFGEVLQTGLQLQRCPDKLPATLPEPPMSGKEADQAIQKVPLVSDAIQADIRKGISGEKKVRLFDDYEQFIVAVSELSLFKLVPKESRLAAARAAATTAKGFTDMHGSREILIYTQGTPKFVTIHELIHAHTHDHTNVKLGHQFVEGVADYFTEIVCEKNDIPFTVVYDKQLAVVRRIAAAIGQPALVALTFNGAIAAAKTIVDSKAAGTWDKFTRAMKNEDEWEQAPDLLDGVADANQAREAKASENERKREKGVGDAKDAEEARKRASWPEERTTPLKSRIIMKAASGSKTICSAGAGGRHGVREGWTVKVVFADRTGHVPVLHVHDTMTTFELPSSDVAAVKEIELNPRAK